MVVSHCVKSDQNQNQNWVPVIAPLFYANFFNTPNEPVFSPVHTQTVTAFSHFLSNASHAFWEIRKYLRQYKNR